MPIGRDEVTHIARLARLALAAGEVDRMTRELSAILDHFAAIRALDVSDVEPLAIAAERAEPLRDDVTERCDPLLAPPEELAPEWRDGFFLLPRLPALDADALEEGPEPTGEDR